MRKLIIPVLISMQFVGCSILKTNNKIDDGICIIDFSENYDILIYSKTDTPPKFKGQIDFTKYLIQEILLKKDLKNEEVKLKFAFEFIINKDGFISSVKCIDRENTNESNNLDNYAIEVIRNSVWEPARCNGKIVAFKKRISIYVSLD